jgi:hypothetical protein
MTAPAHHDVMPYQIADETFLITWGLDAPWREFDQSDLDGWLADAGALSEPSIPAH